MHFSEYAVGEKNTRYDQSVSDAKFVRVTGWKLHLFCAMMEKVYLVQMERRVKTSPKDKFLWKNE